MQILWTQQLCFEMNIDRRIQKRIKRDRIFHLN